MGRTVTLLRGGHLPKVNNQEKALEKKPTGQG